MKNWNLLARRSINFVSSLYMILMVLNKSEDKDKKDVSTVGNPVTVYILELSIDTKDFNFYN